MIAEQLQAARTAHWRQDQNPLLTLEEAESWCRQHPLCLFLPRAAQLPAPAPSFVEACLGTRQTTPQPAAIEQAQGLLTRLVASGAVVALNLFGTVTEQPDFLAHRDALPFVLSLRADADWKHAPQKSSGHKVSPLVLELWKSLEKADKLTAAEAREGLGRELTEAAVLRALCELWQALRISPVYADATGDAAVWEMMRLRHREALTTAAATSQVTALSLLVSMYLQSVYAASSEEIEVFLSPVASRSRVREAVRGLAATRQIHSLSMDAQTYHFLENGLPEFPEVPAAAEKAETAPFSTEDAERRPKPRPAPRKVQATRPPAPVTDLILPRPASEPIFRRPKPMVPQEQGPERRPETNAGERSVAKREFRPAPRSTERRRAARSGWQSPGRPAAKRVSGAPTRDARPERRGGERPFAGKPRFGTGAPSTGPGKERLPYGKPGAPPAGARPEGRGAGRPSSGRPNSRPGSWAGAGKRDKPAPWALPGRKRDSAARPPRAGGSRDGQFRPPQRRERPTVGGDAAGSAAGTTGAGTFRPRIPGGDPDRRPGRPASPYRADRTFRGTRSSAPGGTVRPKISRPGEPPTGRPEGGRPPFPPAGRRPAGAGRSGPPRGADRGPRFDRPARTGFAKPGMGRASAEGERRPSGARSGFAGPSAGRPATGRPATGRPATGRPATGRPATGRPGTSRPGAGRPGLGRPSAGRPATGRPGTGRPGTGRPASGRSGPSSFRPGPSGPRKPRPGKDGPGKDRSGNDRPGNDRPGGTGPRTGSASGKPAKPPFSGRKPDRKKPGA